MTSTETTTLRLPLAQAVSPPQKSENMSENSYIHLESRADVHELIEFARTYSPYYRSLYETSKNLSYLHEYPIVDHTSFWKSNTAINSKVLTGTQIGGVVWKTGGESNSKK